MLGYKGILVVIALYKIICTNEGRRGTKNMTCNYDLHFKNNSCHVSVLDVRYVRYVNRKECYNVTTLNHRFRSCFICKIIVILISNQYRAQNI